MFNYSANFGLSSTQIMRNLSSQLGANYDGGEIRVMRGDREYLMFIYLPVRGGSKGNAVGVSSSFEIKTKIPYSHPFFGIRKSNSLDWVVEHILFMPDYQVGDKEFDQKFYISVKDKHWGARFFSNPEIRLNIASILAAGFDVIRSEDGFLKAIAYLTPDECPAADIISDTIERLGGIISDFPTD